MKIIKKSKLFPYDLVPRYKSIPKTIEGFIKKFGPCHEGVQYLKKHKTLKKAFRNLKFDTCREIGEYCKYCIEEYWIEFEWIGWLVSQLYRIELIHNFCCVMCCVEDSDGIIHDKRKFFYKFKKRIGNPWADMEE